MNCTNTESTRFECYTDLVLFFFRNNNLGQTASAYTHKVYIPTIAAARISVTIFYQWWFNDKSHNTYSCIQAYRHGRGFRPQQK